MEQSENRSLTEKIPFRLLIAGSRLAFDTAVFINCPFDPKYVGMLRPILFCVIDLRMEPRIALERLDSGEPRVDKIIELISQCRFAIHDLSRLRADKEGEFYRLNMPFELGLDVGCRTFGSRKFRTKRCLILEAERYRYQAAISDLSNSDIGVHNNEPEHALREVRNWLVSEVGIRAAGPAAMWARFEDFMVANYRQLAARGFSSRDIEAFPVSELIPSMKDWVGANPE
jgi:hypothetical protein